MGEGAAVEGVRHQPVTATVASLAAMGLVERSPDPEDGRRLLIALTTEGHRRVEEGRQARKVGSRASCGTSARRKTEEERQTVIAAMAVLERLTRD